MSKFFSILVPYYNEGEDVIKNLLDSIAIQQNIDMDEIEVVICKDGPDGPELSKEFLDSYPYDIQYHVEPKGGVSQMRNKAFEYSTGEYVAWADCDDMYYHCLAFWFIKKETTTPMQVPVNGVPTEVKGFDVLKSVFIEEGRNPQNGETYFIDRKDGLQFVHGSFYKRKFIVDNNIHFFEDCYIHEDHVLFAQAQSCTNKIKWSPVPFYLWKWRDNSVCRRSATYIKETYTDLIKSTDRLIEWYKQKSKFDNARQSVVQIVYDCYYNVMCHPSWGEIGTKEYREKAEKRFSEFYKKYKELWLEAPDQMKMQISNGIRQRVVMEGMLQEKVTLDDFLNRMEQLP